MKKVIKNKLYNTESAKEVGVVSSGHYANDFHFWAETLYQKRTGEFFLHGEGGGLSKYCSHVGDMRGYGERIIPLTYKEAQEWAEEHLDGDDYEKIFGEVTEGEDVSLTVWLSAANDSKLRRIAAENGKTLAAQIAEMIEKF